MNPKAKSSTAKKKTKITPERRKELQKLSPERRKQLLDEYSGLPDDQPVTEKHVAARMARSRALMQLLRHRGDGPAFYRTKNGNIFYLKRDVEAYLNASLTRFENTSQYTIRRAA